MGRELERVLEAGQDFLRRNIRSGAAREALNDIGAKLAREDVDAFQTQGRFIETRYKDSDSIKSE